jgi:tetratricopeptide (TPR) repeat protein
VFGFQNVTNKVNEIPRINSGADTNEVIRLNQAAYDARKNFANQTVTLGTRALKLATKLKYLNGIAEAYRVIGIGYSYQFKEVEAFDNYLNALSNYKATNNIRGIAKVDNNLGNLYRDNEYDTAITYFQDALGIAQKLKEQVLIASINLNLGNVYLRKKEYDRALESFDISRKMFEKLNNDPSNLITCYQNAGVAYYWKHDYTKAKELLLKANTGAKALNDMNTSIASIDLTLADLFIAQNDFSEAEKYIKEGSALAQYPKIQADYNYTTYQMEFKRKNYQKALMILKDIYKQDSLDYKSNVNTKIEFLEKKHRSDARQDSTVNAQRLTIERNKNTQYLFWGSSVAAGLLLVVIGLLVANVKRKAQTNKRLTELNGEVSRQKDNLDRINHHLEEIIDERTRDLQVKNKKLSEYSSYLSHQIRGPIATLKGLMNLEKEGLVDKKECISMMNKCVSEIDDKIIDMSDMLHDPDRAGF